MPVDFKQVGPEFTARGLKVPALTVLEPNGHLYDVLAVQPTGTIAARNGFIGHTDRDGAQRRFEHFLAMASSTQCAVALAPEYSCPWETLVKIIAAGKLPQPGKLWILGCEGISPAALQKLIAGCPGLEWIHEQLPIGTGSVLGVLAYITQAETIAGKPRHVVVLQFKTHAMGGDPNERDLLIPGRAVYIWQNAPEYIRLISMICADSLTFNQALQQQCRCDVDPTLIFHPQLTADPLHAAICAYRDGLFLQGATEHLEVISLNWARGFAIPGKGPNLYGGSAIYTKAPRLDTSDGRLNTNHKLGLYFTHWETHRTKLCFFNFNEHVFHFRMPKVAQRGPGVLAQRTGPEMLALWQWDTAHNAWATLDLAVDGFAELCGHYDDGHGEFCLDAAFSHLDRERLLALSAGLFKPGRKWHEVERLDSFTSGIDERCKRLTFTHEQVNPSRTFRGHHLARYSKLQTAVLANGDNFPDNIQDLKNDCHLRPPVEAEEFRFNMRSATENVAPSTGIFLGVAPAGEAQQLFDNVVREWGRDRTRRLVVWFERPNGQIESVRAPLPSIAEGSEPPASIISGGDL